MSQKDQAREAANEHQFELFTRASPTEIIAALDQAANAAPGVLGGKFECLKTTQTAEGLRSWWLLRGPGGFVKVATFVVDGVRRDDGFYVRMVIEQFLYQKGTLFTAPTLNGSKMFLRFRDSVLAQLGSAASTISTDSGPVAQYCPHCGENLPNPAASFCPKCGGPQA